MLKYAAAVLCAAALALGSALSAFAEPADTPADSSSVAESQTETTSTETTPTETTTPKVTSKTTTTTTKPKETTTTTTPQTTTTTTKSDTVTTPETEPDPSEEETKTTTEELASSEEETTTAAEPSDEPTFVALNASEIVDDKFTLTLDISPERKISTAAINIKYDENLFDVDDDEINTDIGGMPAVNSDPGLLTFSYINTAGTDYSGTYLTLYMEVIDPQMTSSVIYVSVETLEDTDLQEIPNNISNAVIDYREESTDESDRPSRADDSAGEGSVFRVKLGDLPLTLEELGVKDIKNVMNVRSLDSSVASYSQGAVSFVGVGETEIIVRMNDDSEQRITIIVAEADEEIQSGTESEQSNKTLRNIAIAITVIGGAVIIFIEYIVICKPFGKKAKKKPSAPVQKPIESSVVEYDEDDVEMVQDPEEVFKRKPKPQPKPQQQAKPKQGKKPQPQQGRNQGAKSSGGSGSKKNKK